MDIFELASLIAEVAPSPTQISFDIIGPIVQIGGTLVAIGIVYGVMKSKSESQAEKIKRMEALLEDVGDGKRIERLEEASDEMRNLMVLLARQEERYNAMEERVLAQGVRIDSHQTTTANIISSQATLINGRLNAINDILSNHTSQIERMSGTLNAIRPPQTRRE